MKTKFFLLIALAGGLVFTACSKDDDSMTVKKSYKLYLGEGQNTKTGTKAPTITTLSNDVASAVAQVNSGFSYFSVTGKGKDETAAAADAKKQAIAVYDSKSEEMVAKMISIKSTFEANRGLSASDILTETGYYAKLTLVFYLMEDTAELMDEIVKESAEYYMEAIGGTDYSSAD